MAPVDTVLTAVTIATTESGSNPPLKAEPTQLPVDDVPVPPWSDAQE